MCGNRFDVFGVVSNILSLLRSENGWKWLKMADFSQKWLFSSANYLKTAFARVTSSIFEILVLLLLRSIHLHGLYNTITIVRGVFRKGCFPKTHPEKRRLPLKRPLPRRLRSDRPGGGWGEGRPGPSPAPQGEIWKITFFKCNFLASDTQFNSLLSSHNTHCFQHNSLLFFFNENKRFPLFLFHTLFFFQ